MPDSIRTEATYRMMRDAAFRKKVAMGFRDCMDTLARMMLLAIMLVASAIFCCSSGSRRKARMTRMPRRRWRISSFCRSMYSSDFSWSGATRLPMTATMTKTRGTAHSTMEASTGSTRKERITPPRNMAGMEMMLLDSISATQERVVMSWVERVTRVPVSILPKARWLIPMTF